eukprot:TRINITY_DN1368_c0_g2_i5.p1 TRINITY_DN1368_c0_g2~~TRINITY_DN1368_c0_g2_i5.p1  ORF type:complete len:401 (-),score=58.33 TRINITY_DN1368_c0_g2_i5:88-1242(-)
MCIRDRSTWEYICVWITPFKSMYNNKDLKGNILRDGEKKTKMWLVFRYRLKRSEKMIIVNLLVQLILCLVLYLLFLISRGTNNDETFFMLASFTIVLITQYYFAYQAVLKANPYELRAFLLLSFITWMGVMFKSLSYYDRLMRNDESVNIANTIMGVDIALTLIQITYPFLFWRSYRTFNRKLHKRIGASPKFLETYKNFELFRTENRMVGSLTVMQVLIIFYIDTKTSYSWLMFAFDVLFAGFAFALVYIGHQGSKLGYKSYIVAGVFGAALHMSYRVSRFVLFLYSLPELHVTYYTALQKIEKPRVNISLLGLIIEVITLAVYVLMVIFGNALVNDFGKDAYLRVVETQDLWRHEEITKPTPPVLIVPTHDGPVHELSLIHI